MSRSREDPHREAFFLRLEKSLGAKRDEVESDRVRLVRAKAKREGWTRHELKATLDMVKRAVARTWEKQ